MLPPHPLLRFSDLRAGAGRPDLLQLVTQNGVHPFYSARAAIYQLACFLRTRGRSTILLPAFHCPSVVEPVLRAGMRPAFYRIDRKLEVDLSDVSARLNADVAAVLFINYLGWPGHFEPLLADLRQRDILAVEDCAHSAVRANPVGLAGQRSDAAIYSFWKCVPSGVGGGLWLKEDIPFVAPVLARAPVQDSLRRTKQLLEELIESRGGSRVARAWSWIEEKRVRATRRFRTPPATANSRSPAIPPDEARQYFFSRRLAQSRLPWMARQIMKRADLQSIVTARRRNYQALGNALLHDDRIAIVHPELPADICPHAFAVMLADRSRHDRRLRAAGVPVWTFGSTLHRVLRETADPAVLRDARHLSDTMLLIPVHPLLATADMEQFADSLNSYAAKEMPCKST